MAERRNQWEAVDENGYDWNSGEEFDPGPGPDRSRAATPAQPAQPAQPSATRNASASVKAVSGGNASASVRATGAASASRTADLRTAPDRVTRLSRADTSAMRGYLDDWRRSAEAQSAERIDRATGQAVSELGRVREETLPQYRTQREQIDADERRSLDNQALYAAARGDRGGVGAEQYNSVMNAAAQNRLTVNSAEVKFKEDIARQIVQIRAQGDYQKEQEFQTIAQSYLSQLLQLEQWAQSYDLSVEQFNAQLAQWEANYLLQLRQLDLSTEQWERSFSYQQQRDAVSDDQWQRSFDASRDDAAWQRRYQQQQADRAENQWQQCFAYQKQRDAVSDDQWQQGFAYQKQRDAVSDNQWQQGFAYQKQRDAVSDDQWQQGFDASRDDAAWQRRYQQQQADRAENQWQQSFDASRSDNAWQRAFQREQYDASRADAARQQAYNNAHDMMNVGLRPDPDTLKDAGLSDAYADLYLSTVAAAKQAGQSGDLNALARAYVASGADSPKTWLAANYKTYGFSTKPDAEEFEDAVDMVQEIGNLTFDFSPDEGVITLNGKHFPRLADFVKYVNSLPLNEQEWNSLIKKINRWPELSAALELDREG